VVLLEEVPTLATTAAPMTPKVVTAATMTGVLVRQDFGFSGVAAV
jgi:hypothetical protein